VNSQRGWSLHDELTEIESALRGIAFLLDELPQRIGDERVTIEIATAVVSVLNLLHLRLRDIGRVLRGELDPDHLYASHNAADVDDADLNGGEDVVFGHDEDSDDDDDISRPRRRPRSPARRTDG
jgi:hypothetical protein